MAKKKKTEKKSESKNKRSKHLWPRITLQSPAADVVRVIELIVKSYKLMRPIDLEQTVRYISNEISISIHTYLFDFEAPIIDRVCDWLSHNYKDDLYAPVYRRWRKLQNLIEKTDQFILDALETKGLNHILPDTGTNDNLWRLFVNIKDFAAILEDTAKALGKSATDKGRKQKPKSTKRKRKAPPEFLKEARERKVANELSKDPNITCVKLAEKLECHKSTVVRLKAWINREVLSSELPKGILTRQEDDSYTVDGIARTEPEDQ